MISLDNSYVYGRILGLYINYFPVPTNISDNYFKSPLASFGLLMQLHYREVFDNEKLKERLAVLLDAVENPAFNNSPVTALQQGEIHAGVREEKEFFERQMGANIKRGRLHFNLTQEQFAEKINIVDGKARISRYETNLVEPNAKTIADMRAVLGYKYI